MQHQRGKIQRLTRIKVVNGKRFSQYVVDCSCGWGSPICQTEHRANQTWEEHSDSQRLAAVGYNEFPEGF